MWDRREPFLLADVSLDARLSPRVTEPSLSSKAALRLVSGRKGVQQVVDARRRRTVGVAHLEGAEALRVPLIAPAPCFDRVAVDAEATLVRLADSIDRGDVVRIDIKRKEACAMPRLVEEAA